MTRSPARQADRDQAMATVRDMGVPILTSDKPVAWAEMGVMPVQFLAVDAAEHAQLPCHAALVGAAPKFSYSPLLTPVERWVTWLCTSPDRHES